MPPIVASFLCFAVVSWLLVRDIRNHPRVSHALWIPTLWYVIIASRMPSEWTSGGMLVMSSGNAYLDGSPLDRNVFLGLMCLGALVLVTRRVRWGTLLTAQNATVVLFFLFTFFSILWSEFPLVAFKRWHKVFGHIIMVLVVLTDAEPRQAFAALLRRSGYVLVPVSVLFLKYYPELGRGFDYWTGAAVNFGITTNKNALGNICLMIGLFFLATLFVAPKGQRLVTGLDRYIILVFLGFIGWLLVMAETSTGLVSTVAGASLILGVRFAPIRRYLTVFLTTGVLAVGLLLALTDAQETFLQTLGEDSTLTGRTELWEDLKRVPINPLVGVGFESFWLGERLDPLWAKYWWQPNQAHNGYFETYLNLGWIGLLLQCAMIVSAYRIARQQSSVAAAHEDSDSGLDRALGEFKLAFVLAIVMYNATDATFKALHPSFFLFFLVALREPGLTIANVIPSWRVATNRYRVSPVPPPPVVRNSRSTPVAKRAPIGHIRSQRAVR